MKKIFTFKIGGEAGFGVMSSGLSFSKLATRSGYYIFDYAEYPSIIRGGHNVMQVTVGSEPVGAPYQSTDLLVALNQETLNLHAEELKSGSGVIYDAEKCVLPATIPQGVNIFAVPINRIGKEIGNSFLLRNTVALGATAALLGGEIQILKDLLTEEFSKRHQELVGSNHKVAQAGYDYVVEHYSDKIKNTLKLQKKIPTQVVVTGNDALSLGAIVAGLQFAAIYPMTPINNILHTLAPLQEKYGFIYKQPEDEIAGINMAIGASFAGARSMVATAGGGFCLMVEGYGLAGMTETPLVIVEGMRGGPATGLPTWTEQGDLRFVLHAHQGEFPRIVLAAGDVNEAFSLITQAFNLADKYQTPVVVMVDKNLCESHQSVPPFDSKDYEIDRGKFTNKQESDYARYALAADGVSLRSVPGAGNMVIANSDEHDVTGYSSEEAENRIKQMEKRMKKLATCAKNDTPAPKIIGPKNADLTILSWGSNKGAILEAMKNFSNVNFLHITWMNPFPAKEVKNILEKSRRVLNIECGYGAQLAGLVKQHTGYEITDHLLKYNGRPFFPEEITARIKKALISKR